MDNAKFFGFVADLLFEILDFHCGNLVVDNDVDSQNMRGAIQ
jgi:hypothetical protein